MEDEETIYKATVINNPTGKNNPILKFKLENGDYIEKEYDYGPSDWGKGQNFNIKYNNNKMKVLERYKFENLYKLPLIIVLIGWIIFIMIFVISIYQMIVNEDIFQNFISQTVLTHFSITMLLFLIWGLSPAILSGLIYYKRERKNREKAEQKTKAKIIAIIPIFSREFQVTTEKTYYEMKWKALFEFKTYDGEIFRCIENRDASTNKFNLNEIVPVRYNIENPLTAFIDTDEYKIERKIYRGIECKAKIVEIETYDIESLENNNEELVKCFKQEYLICEYEINNKKYREKAQFPVNCGMFFVEDEITIRYNADNYAEYNVLYKIK